MRAVWFCTAAAAPAPVPAVTAPAVTAATAVTATFLHAHPRLGTAVVCRYAEQR